jgi:hypothetical protein
MSSIIKDSATLNGSRSRLVPAAGAGPEAAPDLKTFPGFGTAAVLSGFIFSRFIVGLRGLVGAGLVFEVDDEDPRLTERPEVDGAGGIELGGSEGAGLLREREILTGSPSGR